MNSHTFCLLSIVIGVIAVGIVTAADPAPIEADPLYAAVVPSGSSPIAPALPPLAAAPALIPAPATASTQAAAADADTPLKLAMDRILRGHKGEAVLTDLRTGERWISGGVRARMAYNPASTFKLLTAYYGLNRGLIDPDSTLICRPFHYGGKYIRCWRARGHGQIDLRHALGVSCNGLFYTVGLLADAEATQLERLAQAVGYVPADTATTKPELFGHGDGWYVSPLAQAKMLGAIATAGTGLPGGSEIPPVFTDTNALRVVREGMRRALIDGSAKHADLPEFPMAGKTGTLGKQGWFLTFAPYDNPQVTCVVHLDHEWGHQAASIAKRVLQAYLKYRQLGPERFAESLQSIKAAPVKRMIASSSAKSSRSLKSRKASSRRAPSRSRRVAGQKLASAK
jgi:beta-lactamase class D